MQKTIAAQQQELLLTLAAVKNLLIAAKAATSAVTALDVAMTTLRKLGQDDADLHGLANCRRSLAHISRRITSEGKLIFPGEFVDHEAG